MRTHRHVILPAPDVRLWRSSFPREPHPQGTVGLPKCNVRRVLVYHSPDGYEWGYGGSGPADLALNILHKCLPPHCDGGQLTRLIRGKCSELCWRLHQPFKVEFLVGIPEEGGTILGKDIDDWIAVKLDQGEEAGWFATEGGLVRPAPAKRP